MQRRTLHLGAVSGRASETITSVKIEQLRKSKARLRHELGEFWSLASKVTASIYRRLSNTGAPRAGVTFSERKGKYREGGVKIRVFGCFIDVIAVNVTSAVTGQL